MLHGRAAGDVVRRRGAGGGEPIPAERGPRAGRPARRDGATADGRGRLRARDPPSRRGVRRPGARCRPRRELDGRAERRRALDAAGRREQRVRRGPRWGRRCRRGSGLQRRHRPAAAHQSHDGGALGLHLPSVGDRPGAPAAVEPHDWFRLDALTGTGGGGAGYLPAAPMRTLSSLFLGLSTVACVSEHGPLTNRMAQSATPYLARAARQPVSWQPWGRDAFALAARLDRPILLYVGADDCRWCGVMDREVYGDPGLGAMIDSLFVPVRVDRDERPAVADRSAAAVRLLAGLGGYPITAFLTPDGSAFFGGTYFPLDDPVTGRGLRQLLPEVAKTYREQRASVVQRAALVRQLSLSRGGFPHGVLQPAAVRLQIEAVRAALAAAGRTRASLGLVQARAAGASAGARRARAALDTLLKRAYARGRGVRHVAGAGGPVRPLLQDQTQVAWACLAAYDASLSNRRYLAIAEDLVAVLERDFSDSTGGGYFDVAASDPAAPALADRAKPVLDELLPGANAWLARVLLRLAEATQDARYRRRAEATLEAFAGAVAGEAMRASTYLAAAQHALAAR